MLTLSQPKYMCTNCFKIFSKRYERDKYEGQTQRCICGNDKLVRLNREVPIPRKKASNKKWLEFFKKNFMSWDANVYYKKFKESKNKWKKKS